MTRAVVLLLLAACAESPAVTTFDAATCTPGDVELRVIREALGPTRLYALVEHAGAKAALLVDTGSQLSFLSHDGPDGAPNVGMVDFGCEQRRTLRGRPYYSAESVEGRRVIGFLGNDFFLERPRTFDLVGQRIRDGACPATWPTAPIENRYDFLFVQATVDGTLLRLGVDTGAGHTLWLGQDGRPGDQPVSTQDAYGNPLTLYLGSAVLAVAGESRTIPILRVQHFPSLEESNAVIGGGIDGLLGLSTLGDRQFCVDNSGLHLEPMKP